MLRWLTKLEPIHRATTREELEAIYRFRYSIYVEELNGKRGNPDHQRKWLTNPDDEKDYSTILYVGEPWRRSLRWRRTARPKAVAPKPCRARWWSPP